MGKEKAQHALQGRLVQTIVDPIEIYTSDCSIVTLGCLVCMGFLKIHCRWVVVCVFGSCISTVVSSYCTEFDFLLVSDFGPFLRAGRGLWVRHVTPSAHRPDSIKDILP